MKLSLSSVAISLVTYFASTSDAQVQAPALGGVAQPISDSDRIYTGDQSSNTVTVVKPKTGEVLGTIALGDSRLSDVIGPQYIKSVNSHGLGFSRDGKHIVSLSVTSNTVTVIRCEDNSIISQTSVDRNSHEAFFSADNKTIWIGTRGVDHIDIVDGIKGGIVGQIPSFGGPSKVLFSPDGKTAYANHIRSPSISVIDVKTHALLHNITGLGDVFSSDMMLSPDGERLWVAHKMVGKVSIVSIKERRVIGVLETGPETNHPNFAVINGTTYGFVTVAALNQTNMYRQPHPDRMPTFFTSIPASGVEPHGLWPSPDNTRMYVVNEHSDTVDFIDLTINPPAVIKTINVGQEGQALIYVAGAVPHGSGRQNLGTQGLFDRPALNKLVTEKNSDPSKDMVPTALITIRPQLGLEMFQVIGRNLKLNTTYSASASCHGCNGARIPLVDFSASMPTGEGCGTAPQVLAFFKWNNVYDINSLEISQIE